MDQDKERYRQVAIAGAMKAHLIFKKRHNEVYADRTMRAVRCLLRHDYVGAKKWINLASVSS